MLEGLVGLQTLDLKRNKLTSLAPDVFSRLTNLTFLNLGRNSIKKLPPTIFHCLTNLRELMLYNNELEVLEAGIFDKLVNLEELKVHQNRIASLSPKVFWSLRNLRVLGLSSNQLQAVPEKSFYNMPKLSLLALFNNPLLSLLDELMGHMPYITKFYLFGTNLTTVPDNLFANMSGLLELNFHLNEKLRELPSELFCCLPNLQKLSLRSNDLQQLHPHLFSGLNTLTTLLLNDNKLQSLPEGIFQDLLRIDFIDLKNNHLKTLPGEIFSANRGLRHLSLSGNPWDCTCSIRGIAKWIRHNKYVVQDREDMMCHTPTFRRILDSLHDDKFEFCDVTEVTSHDPTQITQASTMHKVQEIEYISTSGPASTIASKPTKEIPTTPASPTPTIKFTRPATIPAITPNFISDAESATTRSTSSSFHTPASTLLHEELLSTTEIPSNHYWSPPFYDKLVVEQGPEFVHHIYHKPWVYVWFLPSDAASAGFLMACHIFLVATGLFLILASMYGMYRLNKTMEELQAECAHVHG
ncbi:hypothetical protein LDENG_00020420 [Lucifuga dentata]|nr:hypothetical protein LDENG_00020420 [Lucifuga dentata]